ncbi:hypothetical protein AMS68_002376 [Peltaster fructicola]|uniref:DUF7918 domain-containing protein n=1 Tax=Peltaster fructicola TaxID=286661 RepID=A0A6H0XQG8_9PEZI|nr:hypothetical protein AMS68_002376 [Peltaster fructicola]
MVEAAALDGFSVTVRSNGAALAEYEDMNLDNDDIVTSRYIKCETGNYFEIVIEFKPYVSMKSTAMCARIYVDNKWADSVITYRSELPHCRPYVSRGVLVSPTKMLRYQFSQLRQDDTATSVDAATVKGIGVITVTIEPVVVTGRSEDRHHDPTFITAVPEKALKGRAVSNVVSYKDPLVIAQRPIVKTQPAGPLAATINLHYRSEADLKALLVIPRSPSPVTAPLDPDALQDELTRLQEEVRTLRAQQDIKPVIKREHADEPLQSTKRARTCHQKVVLVLDDDDTFHEVPLMPTSESMTTDGSSQVESVDLT